MKIIEPISTLPELEKTLLSTTEREIELKYNGVKLFFIKGEHYGEVYYIQRLENDMYGHVFYNGIWIPSYPHLSNIKDGTKLTLEKCVLEEKVNGCLNYKVLIDTDVGKIQIGKIVNGKLNVNVLSYNFEKNVTEYKPILNFHKEKRFDDFIVIQVEGIYKGSGRSKIICTKNHKFYTPNGWMEARDLKVDDTVFQYAENLDYIRQQFILGTLLGDSSVYWGGNKRNCGFAFSHCQTQTKYFDLMMNILGNLCHEGKPSRGGFDGSETNRRAHSVINKQISDFIKDHCLLSYKKTITKKWTEELSFIGISIWYMDDGFLMNNNSNQRHTAGFSTNAYSDDEIGLLINLFNRLGLYSIKRENGILVIDSDSSEKFFAMVSPYIINDMQYKIPENYRSGKSYWDYYLNKYPNTIIPVKVKSVDSGFFKSDTDAYQYDIEVADNSNYFAHDILVHNTNVGIGKYGIRTRMNPFPTEFTVPTFWNSTINEMINKDISRRLLSLRNEMFNRYPEWYVVAGDGEYVGLKVQKVVRHILDVDRIQKYGNFGYMFFFELIGKINPIIIDSDVEFGLYDFDYKMVLLDVLKDGRFVNREMKERIALDMGFEIVPVRFSFDRINELRTAIPMIKSEALVHKIEGYVIKNGSEMVKVKADVILESAYRLNAISKGYIYLPDLLNYISKVVSAESLSKPDEYENLIEMIVEEARADYKEEIITNSMNQIRKHIADSMAVLVADKILGETIFTSRDGMFRYLNTEIPKRFKPLKSYIDYELEKTTEDKETREKMKRRRTNLFSKVAKYCLEHTDLEE